MECGYPAPLIGAVSVKWIPGFEVVAPVFTNELMRLGIILCLDLCKGNCMIE